jgi:uncharacterized protein
LYGEVEGGLEKIFEQLEGHPELRNILILSQVGAGIGLCIAAFLFLTILNWSLPLLLDGRGASVVTLLITGLIVFFSFGPNSLFMEWNQKVVFPEFLKDFEKFAREMEDAAADQTKTMTNFSTLLDLVVGILMIGILPAIGEELVFRGIIQNELFRGTRNIHLSIWTAAILFSAIHFQFYGFIPRMMLGALFGYLYYWSGSLWLAIFAHFFNNTAQVVALYLFQHGDLKYDIESSDSIPISAVLSGTIITAGLLYYFYRYFRNQKPQTHYL